MRLGLGALCSGGNHHRLGHGLYRRHGRQRGAAGDTDEAGATAVDAQWIVESYALFLAALILVGGSLGDHYGRKRIFSLGIVLFAAASVWCGFAGCPEQLIVARAVQGVGGDGRTRVACDHRRDVRCGRARERGRGRYHGRGQGTGLKMRGVRKDRGRDGTRLERRYPCSEAPRRSARTWARSRT